MHVIVVAHASLSVCYSTFHKLRFKSWTPVWRHFKMFKSISQQTLHCHSVCDLFPGSSAWE